MFFSHSFCRSLCGFPRVRSQSGGSSQVLRPDVALMEPCKNTSIYTSSSSSSGGSSSSYSCPISVYTSSTHSPAPRGTHLELSLLLWIFDESFLPEKGADILELIRPNTLSG